MLKRKLLLINPRMQIKYIIIVIGLFITMSLFISWDIFLFLKDIIPEHDVLMRKELIQTFIGIGIKIIIFSIIFSFLGLYLSSRFAGPIHRLTKEILYVSENADLTYMFKIRDNDELIEISDCLNNMLALFKDRLIVDAEFREKVCITSKAMIHILQNKKQINKDEKRKLIIAGNMLMKEASRSDKLFKIN